MPRFPLPVLAFCSLLLAPLNAQDEPAPPDPNLEPPIETAKAPDPAAPEPGTLPPGGYSTPDEVLARCAELGKAEGVTYRELAHSVEGRPLVMLGFGERGGVGRPSILLLADPNGTKPVATQLALALAQNFGSEKPELLRRATLYLVPLANPDAAARAFAGEAARRGAPVDEDRDGRLDEDPAEDLNGDGLVLKMRVPDPIGEWLADEDDPRALRRAEAKQGERGGYRLLDEGIDEDGDRSFNEDGFGGVALDANWPHRWEEHAPEAGPFPISEPLNRALADFVLERPNLAVVIVLGEEDNLARPPAGVENTDKDSTQPPAADAELLKLLSAQLYPEPEEGEDPVERPRGAEPGSGGFGDWCSFQAGRLVLKSAIWSPPLPAGTQDADRERELMAWNDAVYGGDGFVAWTPFDHPQLGAVEIGGWRPLVLANPPMERFPALIESWTTFLNALGDDLPALEWGNLEIEDRGEGVFEARVTLLNPRLLPTITVMGQKTRRLLPIQVRLELPQSGVLLAGRLRQSVDRLAGLGGSQEFRWLFRLPAGAEAAKAVAESQSAGVAEIALEVQG